MIQLIASGSFKKEQYPKSDRWFFEHLQPHEASLKQYLKYSLDQECDVEDALQRVYSKLFRVLGKEEVRYLRGLLFAIARNEVRDRIRKRQKFETVEFVEERHWAMEEPEVFERVSRQEELALLARAVEKLPRRCRQVLILRKMKGLSQKEIAHQLGISENTVENLIYKGTAKCRDQLRKWGVRSR